MIGNQITNNNLKLKNARLIGANGNVSNNFIEQSDYIDEDYSDYVVKNDIPEMKLLPMDYVPSKAVKPSCAPPPPPIKCKCEPSAAKPPMKVTISEPIAVEKNPTKKNPGKYLIYKRKHSIFGTTPNTPEKLQYVNGNDKKAVSVPDLPKAKENRKKYLIFDSKKNNSKLDSIQYYFDNKSYEKYVDNKLYGKLNQPAPPPPPEKDDDADMKGFEHSRSWEYRDNSKTESKLKLFESTHDSNWTTKSNGSTSGASSCSEISLKRRNCRTKPQLKFTTSKSISDLSLKTSHDVNRINQLFANAKSHPAVDFERDKYKVHRKIHEDGDDKLLTKGNLKKYHRSTTELNIKSSPVASSHSSCGFKNCKFSHCPVSNKSTPSSAVSLSQPQAIERRKKFDENFIKKFEDMRKKSSSAVLRNNEITVSSKSSISVNGRSNIIVNDTKSNFPAGERDVFVKDFHPKPNNQNKMTIKINDSCFVVNHANDSKMDKSVIELGATTNWDKNIKVKNNPQPKYDNKVDVNHKIRNEENSVKIYVSGSDSVSPTPSTTLSISSSHDSSDSDKDYGYFDTSSQGRSSSPEFAEMFKKFRQMCSKNSKPLGCDGALFWNNSYFDEDETDKKTEALYACTKCHTTTEDLLSNYICICRNKVMKRSFYCNFPSLE